MPASRVASRIRQAAAAARGRKSGFTLVEILVVMAIMVILFSLLFAPMITGLRLVQRGRRHVAIQDAVRLTLEQIKRELADAVYVFSPEVIHVTSIDGQPASVNVVDYSTITYALAARLPNGQLATPVQPSLVDSNGDSTPDAFEAVRLTVHLVHPGSPHSEENPFALFRQVGYVVRDPADPNKWVWAGIVLSENALTPREGADLPPTLSVCEACGSMWRGYAPKCLNSSCSDFNTDASMRYVCEGAQFVPERVCGEQLKMSADGTLYTATWGGWLGT
ncbi:MAG: type II secretion system protein, partial [Armatimonadetes bacterium]|nr:type II secretion system protein [Armatimonadota bacterium]